MDLLPDLHLNVRAPVEPPLRRVANTREAARRSSATSHQKRCYIEAFRNVGSLGAYRMVRGGGRWNKVCVDHRGRNVWWRYKLNVLVLVLVLAARHLALRRSDGEEDADLIDERLSLARSSDEKATRKASEGTKEQGVRMTDGVGSAIMLARPARGDWGDRRYDGYGWVKLGY
ncbi:hypothetical protein FIBSPDRAFT_899154 [Athelia psychrophila]|uniref:Uncharacterized protein n=1 Tax=Athelia psychrophila TaxID=1759441 RepID=A0A166A195_9AGAM|nr:hypothetical protein FIBSPDRAFT_899154 [Fibularhizoctonia sp. CBS 109695]